MSGRQVQPPSPKQAVVDIKTGCLTNYGQRLWWDGWKRSGGFDDFAYDLFILGNTGDATLAEVAAEGDDNRLQIETLKSLIQSSLFETVQQEILDLRQEVATLNAQLQGIRGEDAQAGLDGKEPAITAGTAAQYWRGDKTFQTLDTSVVPENTNLYFTNARAITAGAGTYATIASLATVATTGAYADLTGKPTLGTAAAQNIGTSGANVPLLDANNSHSGDNTFTKPPAIPAYTVATLPAAATYTNGIAIATDLLAPAIGAIVVGGGAVRSAVISDGTNWRAV